MVMGVDCPLHCLLENIGAHMLVKLERLVNFQRISDWTRGLVKDRLLPLLTNVLNFLGATKLSVDLLSEETNVFGRGFTFFWFSCLLIFGLVSLLQISFSLCHQLFLLLPRCLRLLRRFGSIDRISLGLLLLCSETLALVLLFLGRLSFSVVFDDL